MFWSFSRRNNFSFIQNLFESFWRYVFFMALINTSTNCGNQFYFEFKSMMNRDVVNFILETRKNGMCLWSVTKPIFYVNFKNFFWHARHLKSSVVIFVLIFIVFIKKYLLHVCFWVVVGLNRYAQDSCLRINNYPAVCDK